MRVETFKIERDTIIHIAGIPCRLTEDVRIETNPANAEFLHRAERWPSRAPKLETARRKRS